MKLRLYDPRTDTVVDWDFDGKANYAFRITLKRAVGDLVNAICAKTNQTPIAVLTGNPLFVIEVENERGIHS